MTLEIVKPELKPEQSAFDDKTAKTAIIEGMIDDSIVDWYTAVNATGAKNSGQVKTICESLLTELRNLIATANTAAALDESIDDIKAEIDAEAVNFSSNDLEIMMVEVYGSVTAWKQAMIDTNET